MIIPNTTQIPHIIIREWMPLLKDIELRILLVVADQTLGWIEDPETKRRKERDWISHYQLRTKIKRRGAKPCGSRSVSMAVATLVDDYRIVEAMDEEGIKLNTPLKRMRNGGKIYYRLNLHAPQKTLFDTPAEKAGVQDHTFTIPQPSHKRTPAKSESYKRNYTHKINNHVKMEFPHDENDQKRKENHTRFMKHWHDMVKATRNMKPVIGPSDGKNLKRVLELGIPIEKLEQISLFFLADPDFKKFAPTISTLLSSGILNGLINRTKNDKDFWKRLDRYSTSYLDSSPGLQNQPAIKRSDEPGENVLKINEVLRTMLQRLQGTR